jgi:hypothetical protein
MYSGIKKSVFSMCLIVLRASFPFAQDFGGSPCYPINNVARHRGRLELSVTLRLDAQLRQSLKNRLHCRIRVAKELATANSYEPPADSLKDCLPCHVIRDILNGVKAVAVAFDGKAPTTAFYNKVDSVMAHDPLGYNPKSSAD